MSTAKSKIMIVGIGNAGVTVLDQLAVAHPGLSGLLAVNNDPDSLLASVIPDRITVPEGDPGDGFVAIDEEFGTAVAGAPAVLLCGGLGGATGSFLLHALAVHSKSAGIPTMACVGMPFSFEGRQKREEAERALEKLRAVCDAVITVDNDRLSGGTPSSAAVGEAFGLADRTLLASLVALRGMLLTSGPVRITRSDLHAVLGVPGSLTHFGFGSASGANRLHEAVEKALKAPLLLLHGKPALREAQTILLYLRGPSDVSFAEVQIAVAEIERIAAPGCHIKVGVNAEGPEGIPLELFITTSSGGTRSSDRVEKVHKTPEPPVEASEHVATNTPPPKALSRSSANSNPIASTSTKHPKPEAKPSGKQTQATLDLEAPQRGRFDKSERTIVNGEDLDVPTFIRKGIKLTSPVRK
jgi:cell division protein FtsZ